MVIEMFAKMMRIMFSTSFMWFWMLVFPASVGMQWNNAIGKCNTIVIFLRPVYTHIIFVAIVLLIMYNNNSQTVENSICAKKHFALYY